MTEPVDLDSLDLYVERELRSRIAPSGTIAIKDLIAEARRLRDERARLGALLRQEWSPQGAVTERRESEVERERRLAVEAAVDAIRALAGVPSGIAQGGDMRIALRAARDHLQCALDYAEQGATRHD